MNCRKEFIKQQCQNSFLPKNCFQCPICSSVLSSVAWKYPSINSPKSNFKAENNLKFNCKNILPNNDSSHHENSNFDLNSSISFNESCKIEEKCKEKVKFPKQYKSEEKITFRNPPLNIGNCLPMDSNRNQYNAKEIVSCVKDCKRYKKKQNKKQVSCKFKLDQKEDIFKSKPHLSKANNNHLNSSQNTDEKINKENNNCELCNNDNLIESSSNECVNSIKD